MADCRTRARSRRWARRTSRAVPATRRPRFHSRGSTRWRARAPSGWAALTSNSMAQVKETRSGSASQSLAAWVSVSPRGVRATPMARRPTMWALRRHRHRRSYRRPTGTTASPPSTSTRSSFWSRPRRRAKTSSSRSTSCPRRIGRYSMSCKTSRPRSRCIIATSRCCGARRFSRHPCHRRSLAATSIRTTGVHRRRATTVPLTPCCPDSRTTGQRQAQTRTGSRCRRAARPAPQEARPLAQRHWFPRVASACRQGISDTRAQRAPFWRA
mmetsp:Transcript_65639/g.201110  ORF Transcript_65639/g.201110 Transcript_65639/m.201110 type:complete len:270 (-) Transcript_65639:605-1414(-)